MTEDEIYRTSTQYRLWSFTPESLASLRSTTNATAADGVRAAIRALDAVKADSHLAENGGKDGALASEGGETREVDCLTVEEEQKLVGFYCMKTIEFAEFCEFPTNVKATAVQFLKRFYLSNSPMTYHPKEMMPSALFLATKTENNYISLRAFAEKLPKATPEMIIAPEFLLTQGLRFTFDVRHPQHGLEGGFMELVSMARGQAKLPLGSTESAVQLQNEMLGLERKDKGGLQAKTPEDVIKRIQAAHTVAKEILKTSALLSDVYFFYTPSQIWLAAFLIADETLASFYIKIKIPLSSPVREKVVHTLSSCGALMNDSVSMKPGKAELKELTRIDKKLYKCRNPEKVDLVGINKAQKRDGEAKDGSGLNEKVVKKRKLERENSTKEGEDVFGPPLAKIAKE